jgi:SAM-dependent methyltransferase
LHGLRGAATQGSVLQAPFADASFERVVVIGCFHHTGDMQRAIDESCRMLRPGGRLTMMVYCGLSYRRWRLEPRGVERADGPATPIHDDRPRPMMPTARPRRTPISFRADNCVGCAAASAPSTPRSRTSIERSREFPSASSGCYRRRCQNCSASISMPMR